MVALVTTVRQLLEARGSLSGGPAATLVPTMGALHAGHRALIAAGRALGGPLVVSIFVNPLQFGPGEDFARYPRDLNADLALAEAEGCDIVFAPSAEELYPDGEPDVTVDPGPLGAVLEGASRPGHLRGVATVVAKLFALVAPGRALFGEKDYQQLVLVRRLVADLSFPVDIVAHPTVREPDGLALSSRNARLSQAERAAATVLYRALSAGAALAEGGGAGAAALEEEMAAVVAGEALAELDYAVVRRADDLAPVTRLEGELRLLVAARVGPVRLIDNLALSLPGAA